MRNLVTIIVLCFVFSVGTQSAQAVDDPNALYPIGFYEFNELDKVAGDITLDLGTSVHPFSDGLLHGNATIVDDAGGNGKGASRVLSYTRDAVGGAICQELAKYNNPGSITVAAWAKLSSGDVYPPFVEKFHSFKLAAVRQSHFSFWGKGITMRDVDGTHLTGSDTWHHLVGTFDSATGAAYLYLDGGEVEFDLTGNLPFFSNDNLMVIGGTIYDTVRVGTCKIDEVAIYDVALDADDVLNLYQNGPMMDKAHSHSPFNAEEFAATAVPTTLSWTNSIRAISSAAVWFGTDPESAGTVLGDDTLLNTSATIPEILVAGNTYYWAVDDTEPNDIPGRMVSFEIVTNVIPEANAGDDQEVWLTAGSVEVQLDGSGSFDDGTPAALVYTWTEVTPSGNLGFDNASSETPTATITAAGTYTLNLNASDTELSDDDTVTITVYADACAHAQAQQVFAWKDGDVDHDCDVDRDEVPDGGVDWIAVYASY